MIEQLLTSADVEKITGLSRVTLWRKSHGEDDPFPRPYKYGPRFKRWKLSEIELWIDQLEKV